jgi:hypothetical protein
MKKNLNNGFVLIETLIVTTFVSGVLVFLFIQLSTLSNNYDNSYKYNIVEDLYALRNIKNYLSSDASSLISIKTEVDEKGYVEFTDCSMFTEEKYCLKLLELENIKTIFITKNYVDESLFNNYNDGLKQFIGKINGEGENKYRILAEFNNSRYATIRIGD